MIRHAHAGLRWMAVLLGLASAGPAYAGKPDAVWLELPECATPPYDTRELLRTLELELGSHQLQLRVQPPRATGAGLGVSLALPRCDADADSLTLQYRDGDGQRSRKRALSLRDVPKPARPRTLALVIAEALRPSCWPGAAAPAEPSAPAEQTPTRQRTLAPATADPLSVKDASALFVRQFPRFGASLRRSAPGDGVHDDPLISPDDPYPWTQRLQIGFGAHARLVTREGNLLPGAELNLRGQISRLTNLALEAFYTGGRTWTAQGGELNLNWYGAGAGFDARLSETSQLRFGPRLSVSHLEDDWSGAAAMLTAVGGRLDFGAWLMQRATLDVRMELAHSLYVKALSHDRDSLPWYGWIVTWGAGVSLDVI
jgi:hypothetical protein